MSEKLDTDLPPDLFKKLLINPASPELALENLQTFKPTPGFCVKTKDGQGNKVFINLCYSDGLPAPQDISEDELQEILIKEENEIVNYRVPLSLGEARNELDKAGNLCMAYDVAINSEFYKKVSKSVLFRNFVIQVAFEGLEDKHRMSLEKQDWTILKNRKYLGNVTPITVKKRTEQLITEIERQFSNSSVKPQKNKDSKAPLIQEVESKFAVGNKRISEPQYKIMQDPLEGHPSHLVAEFQLPGVMNAKAIELDLGEDRIVLQTQPDKYFLDIFIPFSIVVEESGAQYDVDQQVLTLTMAVLPQS